MPASPRWAKASCHLRTASRLTSKWRATSAFYAGLRHGEFAALRWPHVDLATRASDRSAHPPRRRRSIRLLFFLALGPRSEQDVRHAPPTAPRRVRAARPGQRGVLAVERGPGD